MKACRGISGKMGSAYSATSTLSLALAMIMGISFSVHAASPGDIVTVAGGGVGDNSPATSVSLYMSQGVTVDSSGNLYIADQINKRIRKVAAGSGIITTVAGNGTQGFAGDGGVATSASLYSPNGVTVDSDGNLFIADTNRIRKVVAGSGIITTVAGNGTQGFAGDGAAATSSNLYGPCGVTVDSAGNLYIADLYNHRIRKVAADTGIITTVAGNGIAAFGGDGGAATAASINYPYGITVDSAGNLYIADRYNHRIRKVAANSGIITTVAGNGIAAFGGDGGAATEASLSWPNGVTIDSAGNLYIADYSNSRIRKVAVGSGIITTVAGNGTRAFAGDGGAATSASLGFSQEVTVDSAGNLFIVDVYDNKRIRKVAADTGIITTVAGNGTRAFAGDGGAATSASLSSPYGVIVDSTGNLYIADSYNHCIRKVAAGTGIITTVAGNSTRAFAGDGGVATLANLNNPYGVAVDSAGNLYIADSSNHRIRKVAADTGIITTVAGVGNAAFGGDGGAATAAYLNEPHGVTVDSAGNLFIADTSNHCIRKVAVDTGIITTVAGYYYNFHGFTGDGGAATAASLNGPSGVTVNSAGDLFIADSANSRIRKVAAITGVITTVAGNGAYPPFTGDGGAATAASLYWPNGVIVDSAGNLYIADRLNDRIRKVAAGTGIITTVAGKGGTRIFAGDNGAATLASLYNPQGVTLDSAGNLYIADQSNNRIRKVIKPGATTAAISYSPAGPYKTGDLVTITATFNDLVADAPAPQIALSGANTLTPTSMTRVDYRHYQYTHTVGAGSGNVTVSLPSGIDINGVPLSATPGSGATFSVFVPVPGAPTGVSASAGNAQATVSFSPPAADGGSAITSFTVTSSPGNLTATGNASPITVTGLTNGTAYTFSVTATSAAGTGAVSTYSNSVTPVIPVYALTLSLAGTGGGSVSGNLSCMSGSSCQPLAIAINTPVNLIPLADSTSIFTGWSGACTNSSGSCTLTMNSAKTVTATFTAAPRVKVGVKEFATIQGANNDAATQNNAIIKLLEGTLTENVIFGRSISLTLDGGYNAAFDSVSTETTVKGSMQLRAGTVRVKKVNVR